MNLPRLAKLFCKRLQIFLPRKTEIYLCPVVLMNKRDITFGVIYNIFCKGGCILN